MNVPRIRFLPVTPAYALQYFSQLTYLLVAVSVFGWVRYSSWYAIVIAFSIALNLALSLAQSGKRVALVQRAMQSGVIAERDL